MRWLERPTRKKCPKRAPNERANSLSVPDIAPSYDVSALTLAGTALIGGDT
jgi:hypothetical protein